MGFRVNITGAESINLDIDTVTKVKYLTNTPNDSNARSKDVGATMIIEGKIMAGLEGAFFDGPKKLGEWSLVTAEKADSYRKIEAEVIAAGKVIRKITFPNAFVIDYTEHYGDTEGVGIFKLVVRQKKDKIASVAIEGGYDVN